MQLGSYTNLLIIYFCIDSTYDACHALALGMGDVDGLLDYYVIALCRMLMYQTQQESQPIPVTCLTTLLYCPYIWPLTPSCNVCHALIVIKLGCKWWCSLTNLQNYVLDAATGACTLVILSAATFGSWGCSPAVCTGATGLPALPAAVCRANNFLWNTWQCLLCLA